MRNEFKIYCLLLLLTAFFTAESQAQTNINHSVKYNKSFSGTGPKVYILPPPRTEKEVLLDQYSNKKKDQAELLKLMNLLDLSNRLKKTDNGKLPGSLVSSEEDGKESQLIAAINYYKQMNLGDSVLAWQNQLGIFKLLKGEIDESRKLFKEVLNKYQLAADLNNQQALLQNLAILEEQSENYVASLGYYDRLIILAKNSKNIQDEGLINLSIATIESKLGNYSAAHNLVIKKSFPLLQKFKYFPDVVNALNTLAAIKESEGKLIEAKWIYLQAIDVATIHKAEKGLAMSFYNLAKLKTQIGDATLAIADYKAARDLAAKNKMNGLLVEIEDGLGDAYLNSGNYAEAALALNAYNILKVEFINKQSLM